MSMPTVVLIAGLVMILAGCVGLIRTHHMLKIIIGLEVAMKAVTVFIILGGFLNGRMALAQAFVVTVIVVEVVTAVVLSGIAISLYRKHGSMDIRNRRSLKG